MPMISFRASDDLASRIKEASEVEGTTRWLIGVVEAHLRAPNDETVAALRDGVQAEPDLEHAELVKSYERALSQLRDEVAFLKAELARKPGPPPGRPATVEEAKKIAAKAAFPRSGRFDPKAVDRLLSKEKIVEKAGWDE